VLSLKIDMSKSGIADYPWFMEHGPYDVPTFIVNILTLLAIFGFIFEMLSWVNDWNRITENGEDPDGVEGFQSEYFEKDSTLTHASQVFFQSIISFCRDFW